jgi:hypothetical protein
LQLGGESEFERVGRCFHGNTLVEGLNCCVDDPL